MTDQEPIRCCPQCRQPMTLVGNFWVCPVHGAQPVAMHAATPSPPEIVIHPLLELARDLPFPLALVLAEYVREDNPFVKLHRLTDAAEMLTRFATMVLLSDVLRQRGVFPEVLRRALSEKIERPTFGAWKDLLALACESLPKRKGHAQCFVPGFPAYVKEHLLPLLGSGGGDPTREIIALRNVLAHRGRFSDIEAQRFLAQHQQPFEALLAALRFLTRYTLLAYAADGRILALRGLPLRDGTFPPYESPRLSQLLQPERVLLIRQAARETTALDLFPLHAFSAIWQWREDTLERVGGAVPQVYFRLSSKGYLGYGEE